MKSTTIGSHQTTFQSCIYLFTAVFIGAMTVAPATAVEDSFFDGNFNLANLDGTYGFVLSGIDPGDHSGYSVSNAGDVNDDGMDDLIIGAPSTDPSGECYVVFGGAGVGTGGSIELGSLDGGNGFVIESGFGPGISVSNAGDVNGDGIEDLVIGGLGTNSSGAFPAGVSYVVFGSAGLGAGGTFELNSLDGTNGFTINGIDSGDASGGSVSSAGDVNGDGLDDLIIGASLADRGGRTNAGESYVIFGNTGLGAGGTFELSNLDGTNGYVLKGIYLSDQSGYSVSNAGDVNGDGMDDLIIGADLANLSGKLDVGASYVVFGGADVGTGGTIDLGTLDGTNGFVLEGINPGDRSGCSVSNAGDVNGDGTDDLIVGARRADPGGNIDAGESYVVFGGVHLGTGGTFELSNLDGTNGFVLQGVGRADDSGVSVSNAGDVNGDGTDDIIIGAMYAYSHSAGEAYVVFGAEGLGSAGMLELSSLNGTNGFVMSGVHSDGWLGHSVSNAGDVNGDGVDDLIVGAYRANPNGLIDAGESYVVFGQRIPEPSGFGLIAPGMLGMIYYRRKRA